MLCCDTNKDIYKKELGHRLTADTRLGMREVVDQHTGKKLGATFFRGSKPIDSVWATPDLAVTHACVQNRALHKIVWLNRIVFLGGRS